MRRLPLHRVVIGLAVLSLATATGSACEGSSAEAPEGRARGEHAGHADHDDHAEAEHAHHDDHAEAEDAGHADHDDQAHAEDAVTLDPAAIAEFAIEVGTAGPGWVGRSATLPAEVRPNQDRVAHIAPRYAGIVREVRAEIGDAVKAGQTLAMVESENLSTFALRTLIDGVVIEKHITPGEPITPGDTAFVVADLRNVWVDISVYQRALPQVAVGQPVHVSAGHGLAETDGTLAYVSPVVDEATRTATARVVLPNDDGAWRPGMFVTARVQLNRAEVPVAVPDSALHRLDDGPAVFVEESGTFRARPVRIGRRGDATVEITGGLSAGERIVVRGGFTLKSELLREELSGGHSH